MTTQSAPILVTRPLAEGEAFAAALSARFGPRVRPVVSPLLAPRNLMPDLPDGRFCAVVFTSAQAVEAARPYTDRLPLIAWCVGNKTAKAAEAAGFQARSADGEVEALIAALVKEPPKGRILYLRGVDTASNLLARLYEIGVEGSEAIVYLQEPQALGVEALALFDQASDLIVPLFSPRTARLFRDALPPVFTTRLHIAAMSANVADACSGLPCAALTVARRPTAEAMLDAVETLLAGLPPP